MSYFYTAFHVPFIQKKKQSLSTFTLVHNARARVRTPALKIIYVNCIDIYIIICVVIYYILIIVTTLYRN